MRAGATEQVTTKLNALIPAAFDAKHFSDTFKETVCNVQQLDYRKLMKPYSDGWESWSCSTFSPGRSEAHCSLTSIVNLNASEDHTRVHTPHPQRERGELDGEYNYEISGVGMLPCMLQRLRCPGACRRRRCRFNL